MVMIRMYQLNKSIITSNIVLLKTYTGGAYQCGAIYKIDSNNVEHILYNIGAGGVADGCNPINNGGVVFDGAGTMYGTNNAGGTGQGTI